MTDSDAQFQLFRPSGEEKAQDLSLGAALGLGPDDSPFPWQERLFNAFLTGSLPRSLDIPTGLGKTATMAIWLLARARGAPLPRRLVYIVDRRAVVDQATSEAERLRDWVGSQASLQDSLGLADRSLPVSTLRGQFVDNREWMEDPASPAIIVGTVDMVGSRLLFQGYRSSRKIRPYLAGLLGSDCLFVLDEAHLVPPFERLLEAITGPNEALFPGHGPVQPPRARLLSLSATGRSRGGSSFGLDESDLLNETVRRRVKARKSLSIEALQEERSLAEAVAERAWELSDEGQRPLRCIVYLNSRKEAEESRNHLAKLAGLDKKPKKNAPPPLIELELLVGARRVFERVAAAERLRELGFLAGKGSACERPAFLFATSAGEVGVDLDADHMICDLVPWERMVQRLGRVNRRGQGAATVQVFFAGLKKADERREAQREALLKLLRKLPVLESDLRDGSPAALTAIQAEAERDQGLRQLILSASTPDPLYPPLERPTVDAWAMTSLEQHPGRPSIVPWLRGWVEDRPQASVIWRLHLPFPEGSPPRASDLKRFFEAAPPHASERLQVESQNLAGWLSKRAKLLMKTLKKAAKPGELRLQKEELVAIALAQEAGEPRLWRLQELAEEKPKELEFLLRGQTLVLRDRFGGLSAGGLLDAKIDAAPRVIDGPAWLECNEGEAPVPRFRVRPSTLPAAVQDPSWRERERLPLARNLEGEVLRWLVVEKWRHDAATEEDRSAGRPQLLGEHLEWTADRARDLARRLELPKAAERVLVIAARLHDLGKAASNWQRAFNAPEDGIYAKTRGPVNTHLLDGYRHEFGSLPEAERDEELRVLPEEDQELVLHLIASHHGFARPCISMGGCPDAPPKNLVLRARAVALRFARLQRRWGPWGLAWWEMLLRASDQQASRANDQVEVSTRREEG